MCLQTPKEILERGELVPTNPSAGFAIGLCYFETEGNARTGISDKMCDVDKLLAEVPMTTTQPVIGKASSRRR
jgi:hypothetical protein